jgi:hypothetical protein
MGEERPHPSLVVSGVARANKYHIVWDLMPKQLSVVDKRSYALLLLGTTGSQFV